MRKRIHKKNTWIDMTPFVDVAFLILTFFILVTKFKAEDVVTIKTPSSVSSEVITNENDAIVILFDKKGKVYFQVAQNSRKEVLKSLYFSKSLPMNSITEVEFMKLGFIATPLDEMTSYYAASEQNRKELAIGIPATILNNELSFLIKQIHDMKQGKEKWYIKGDNLAKYPSFKHILKSLKENGIYEFNLITSTEAIPSGTALEREMSTKKK